MTFLIFCTATMLAIAAAVAGQACGACAVGGQKITDFWWVSAGMAVVVILCLGIYALGFIAGGR